MEKVIKELKSRIKQLEKENAELKKDNEKFLVIRNTVSKTILGSIDTLKVRSNSRISTKVNFRENDSYIACLESAYESLNHFFKTISELKRAALRVGLLTILIEFGKKAEKGDIHYGLPEVKMLDNIKKILSVMLKLASIERDNIVKRTEKEFEERKKFAIECNGDIIDKEKLDALDKSKTELIDIYTPDFTGSIEELILPDNVKTM